MNKPPYQLVLYYDLEYRSRSNREETATTTILVQVMRSERRGCFRDVSLETSAEQKKDVRQAARPKAPIQIKRLNEIMTTGWRKLRRNKLIIVYDNRIWQQAIRDMLLRMRSSVYY